LLLPEIVMELQDIHPMNRIAPLTKTLQSELIQLSNHDVTLPSAAIFRGIKRRNDHGMTSFRQNEIAQKVDYQLAGNLVIPSPRVKNISDNYGDDVRKKLFLGER
jgi:hypothetical protein